MVIARSNRRLSPIMFGFGRPPSPSPDQQWMQTLDIFVRAQQREFAALTWALAQEQADPPETLGIDLRPTPHLIACPKPALESLNRKVGGQLRELLGVIDGYQPERELLLLGIGEGQIKAIVLEPDLPPPDCLAQFDGDVAAVRAAIEPQLATILADSSD